MIPPAVLSTYPAVVRSCHWVPLPPGGGLNGGRVWRGELDGEPLFALKRWPVSHTPERMHLVHDRVRAVADLDFTPRLIQTTAGSSVVAHAGCCWDLTSWMSGTCALLTRPSAVHLRAAGIALAALHSRWVRPSVQHATCGAISRRLDLIGEWERCRFRFEGRAEDVAELVRSVESVRHRLDSTRSELRRLAPLRGQVVAIHGDFWPENVLFQQNRLTAVLDYGNVGFDHPEVDLGRLFADVPGWDTAGVQVAVAGYDRFELSVPVIESLATTGRLCSLANWHLRLNAGSPDVHLLPAALPRIRRLVALISDADRLG